MTTVPPPARTVPPPPPPPAGIPAAARAQENRTVAIRAAVEVSHGLNFVDLGPEAIAREVIRVAEPIAAWIETGQAPPFTPPEQP